MDPLGRVRGSPPLPSKRLRSGTTVTTTSPSTSSSVSVSPSPLAPLLLLSPAVIRHVTASLLTDGSLLYDGALYAFFRRSPPPPPRPFIAALLPIRPVLQSFLSDEDAMRLLRVSRTTAFALLSGFIFQRHVFQPETPKEMRQMETVYKPYDLRPTRLCLPMEKRRYVFNDVPLSLTTLLFAPNYVEDGKELDGYGVFDSAVGDAIVCPWTRLGQRQPADTKDDSDEYTRVLMDQSRPVQELTALKADDQYEFDALPLGLHTHGLLRLQIAVHFSFPLQPGALPPSLEVLQFDVNLRHPLSIGVLPLSLVHLVIRQYDFPIQPGVLPPSLERLYLKSWNFPLQVDGVNVLPASLKALQLTVLNQPLLPHVLPSGLTHLVVRRRFTQEVQQGMLPSSLFSLDLGQGSQRALRHFSVLPRSLRVLFLHTNSDLPLLPNQLPDGLEVLHWRHWRHEGRPDIDLLPGLLPNSLQVLDLGQCDLGRIAPLAIPASVRVLRLREQFEQEPVIVALAERIKVTFSGRV